MTRDRPLANRVAPDGALIATRERGLFFGNRGGRFHDPQTQATGRRRWASRQWISCVLAFKGRDRSAPDSANGGIWGRGYTELFFCDEVTALAAGHRPCMECRRADALAWRAALVAGLRLPAPPLFPTIDRMLDAERREGREKRVTLLPAQTLPDGAMFREAGRFFAVRGGKALPWSPGGYGAAVALPSHAVEVLTPPTTLAALRAGYAPVWHSTAP